MGDRRLSKVKNIVHLVLLIFISLTRSKYLILLNNKIVGSESFMDLAFTNHGWTIGISRFQDDSKRTLPDGTQVEIILPRAYINLNSWNLFGTFFTLHIKIYRAKYLLTQPLDLQKLLKSLIYILPKEKREEYLGDIEEIRITLKERGHSDLWIKFICFINTLTVFLAALRIRILDLFDND